MGVYNEIKAATHSYVATCTKCGVMCCAIVDCASLKNDIARETAAWIRAGLTVERVTHVVVREKLGFCKCKTRKKSVSPDQKRLF